MRNVIGKILLFFSTLILFGCAVFFVQCSLDRGRSVGAVNELKKEYVKKGKKISEERNTGEEAIVFDGLDIDFEALKKENSDIIAWVDIPGSSISYPVLQGEDDDYYLHHTIHGEYSAYGSIFLSSLNDRGFDDSHSVLYGHNMNDGTMFAKLNDFTDPTVHNASPMIHIYLPGKVYVYHIFSIYQAEVGGDSFALDYPLGSRNYQEQIRRIQDASAFDTKVKIYKDRPFLTLLTCNPWQNYGSRTSVNAILENQIPYP